MRILNLGASTSGTAQIETPMSKLGFRYSCPIASIPVASQKNGFEALKVMVGNATIKLTKQTPSGQNVIVDTISVIDVAEMSSFNEGQIGIYGNLFGGTANPTTADSTFQSYFTVDISNFGSLDINQNTKYILDYTTTDGLAIEVFAIDTPNLTDIFTNYVRNSFLANQVKEIDVTPYYALALNKANFVEMTCTYANGRSIVFSKSEVEQIVNDLQPTKYSFNGITDSGVLGKYLVCPIGDAIKVRITNSNTATDYYLMSNEQIA